MKIHLVNSCNKCSVDGSWREPSFDLTKNLERLLSNRILTNSICNKSKITIEQSRSVRVEDIVVMTQTVGSI